jgi:signal transduction histidine kinase
MTYLIKNEKIFVHYDELLKLTQKSNDFQKNIYLKTLKTDLNQLETLQWKVEDTVHLPGNNIPLDIYLRKITPVKMEILNWLANLINLEKANGDLVSARNKLVALSDARAYFLAADSKLHNYLITAFAGDEVSYRDNVARSQKNIIWLVKAYADHHFEDTNIIFEVTKKLQQYQAHVDLVINKRKLENYNQALTIFKYELQSTVQSIASDLSAFGKISAEEKSYISQSVLQSEVFIRTMFLSFIALFILITVTKVRANSKRLSMPLVRLRHVIESYGHGKLRDNERIDIQGNDDVHLLSDAFNEMREELKAHQQELEYTLKKLRLSNNAKSLFLTSMSHEFRTPLNSIMGYSQLLAIKNKKSSEVQSITDKILIAGVKLQKMVESALEIANVEQSLVKPEYVDIYALSKVIIDKYNSAASEKNIAIKLVNELDQAVLVFTVKSCVERILSELVDNAIHYNSDGGKIEVFIKEGIDFGLLLMVKDSGVGIQDKMTDKLFTIFERMGREAIDVDGGLGVGLAISKQLALLIGADLSYEHNPEGGSIFLLQFQS